jgi:hypothetical protein
MYVYNKYIMEKNDQPYSDEIGQNDKSYLEKNKKENDQRYLEKIEKKIEDIVEKVKIEDIVESKVFDDDLLLQLEIMFSYICQKFKIKSETIIENVFNKIDGSNIISNGGAKKSKRRRKSKKKNKSKKRGGSKKQKCKSRNRKSIMKYFNGGDTDGVNADECSICFDSGEGMPEVCENHHKFHNTCISEWIQRGNQTCPFCRSPISDNILEPILNQNENADENAALETILQGLRQRRVMEPVPLPQRMTIPIEISVETRMLLGLLLCMCILVVVTDLLYPDQERIEARTVRFNHMMSIMDTIIQKIQEIRNIIRNKLKKKQN